MSPRPLAAGVHAYRRRHAALSPSRCTRRMPVLHRQPEDWAGDVSAESGFGARVREGAAQCATLIAPYVYRPTQSMNARANNKAGRPRGYHGDRPFAGGQHHAPPEEPPRLGQDREATPGD